MPKLRILVIDDHQILREGLVRLLGNEPDFEVVGDVGEGETGVALAAELRPDVVVMDLSIPDLTGIEATRRIRANGSGARVLALTMHADPDYAVQFLDAGGSGYWLKESGVEELVTAVRRVACGEEAIAQAMAESVARRRAERPRRGALDPADELTFRERQVLQLVCAGSSSKQIARLLKISVRTVEQYRASLIQKAGVSNTAGLVSWAVGNKLVVPSP